VKRCSRKIRIGEGSDISQFVWDITHQKHSNTPIVYVWGITIFIFIVDEVNLCDYTHFLRISQALRQFPLLFLLTRPQRLGPLWIGVQAFLYHGAIAVPSGIGPLVDPDSDLLGLGRSQFVRHGPGGHLLVEPAGVTVIRHKLIIGYQIVVRI
jgi:hypothetical protein